MILGYTFPNVLISQEKKNCECVVLTGFLQKNGVNCLRMQPKGNCHSEFSSHSSKITICPRYPMMLLFVFSDHFFSYYFFET